MGRSKIRENRTKVFPLEYVRRKGLWYVIVKMAFNPGSVSCALCGDLFSVNENMVNSGGQVWHQKCFV